MPSPSPWKLCQRLDCPERLTGSGQQDPDAARLRLQAGLADASKMRELRRFLVAELGAGDLSRVSDEMVIRRLASLLASGRIHLHQGMPAAAAQGGSASQQAVPDQAPAPFPMARQAPRASSSLFQEVVAAVEEFMPHVDLPVQVATLLAAATDGKPFCPE